MITERIGDLLKDTQVNVIAHQCNCFHTMGGGIARIIAQIYPEAAEADRKTPYGSEAKLGTFSIAKTSDGKRIVNIYGQFNTSNSERATRYDALYTGLEKLESVIRLSTNPEQYIVGVPYGLGSALGGGSWLVVRAMLERIFGESPVQLHIVRLPNIADMR